VQGLADRRFPVVEQVAADCAWADCLAAVVYRHHRIGGGSRSLTAATTRTPQADEAFTAFWAADSPEAAAHRVDAI